MAEEQAQPTLRETLEEQVAAAREEQTPVTPEPAGETEAQRAERVRDEQGRFAKAEAKPPVAAQDTPAAAPVVEEPQLPKPPSSWKKELWPVWESLHKGQITPEHAKALVDYIPQREQQFATGVSTYKQIADSAKPLLDAIAPFQADLQQHGIQAADMVGRLMSAHKTLALGSPAEKLQLFGKLAQDYGIPLQAFFDQNAQQQYLATPHTPQPAAQPQQPNIEALVESAIAAREVRQTVESIEKDTQNYPFFQYVRSTMAQLLETNEATDLNDAYHKALERPEHAMLVSFSQQQQERAERERQAEAAKVAARVARSNAVSPKSATPMGGPVNEAKDVRSALKAAIEQHRGGARV